MFFFNDTATTEIYTLSLHDALPISRGTLESATKLRPSGSRKRASGRRFPSSVRSVCCSSKSTCSVMPAISTRSEEHTSELQSRQYLVCRLLLEKKKKDKI